MTTKLLGKTSSISTAGTPLLIFKERQGWFFHNSISDKLCRCLYLLSFQKRKEFYRCAGLPVNYHLSGGNLTYARRRRAGGVFAPRAV
jgi:hypothetical protein